MKRSLMTVVALSFPILFAACGDDDDEPTIDADVAAIDASDIDASDEPATCETFAGCTEFAELGDGETITITGTAPNFVYTPKCVRITVGDSIVLPGSATHPLKDAACSVGIAAEASTAPVTFTPTEPGIYGFYCTSHGAGAGEGTGQVGAIEVVAAQ